MDQPVATPQNIVMAVSQPIQTQGEIFNNISVPATMINTTLNVQNTATVQPNIAQAKAPIQPTVVQPTALAIESQSQQQVLTKARLGDLIREVDVNVQLDEDVEEMLLSVADEFIYKLIGGACQAAKHRQVPTVEVKDIQLILERYHQMWIPGFGTDELKPYKRSTITEAHKQRLALIRRALKKY